MNKLQAGFSRLDVTPPLGIPIVGYYKPRFAEGVLDELEVNALALAVEDKKVVLLSVDNCGFSEKVANAYRDYICEVTGLPADCIFLHATHTHTGPSLRIKPDQEPDELVQEYRLFVYHRMADVAAEAIADMKPAKMGYAEIFIPTLCKADEMIFIRTWKKILAKEIL